MASQRDTRTAWQTALAKVAADAEKAFPDNRGKVAQLQSLLITASSVIDDMHDYPAPVPHTF